MNRDSMRRRLQGAPCSFRLVGEPLEQRLVLSANAPGQLPIGSSTPDAVSGYRAGLANTGVNAAETTLTPGNVNSDSFGKLFTTTVDGQIYAQPLAVSQVAITAGPSPGVHDVVFAATMNDSLYAVDAESGKILWFRNFLSGLPGATVTPVPDSDVGTPEIGAVIGIMSTPVIDQSTDALYLVANTKEVVNGIAHYVCRLHAVDIRSGAEIGTSVIGDTSVVGSQLVYNSGPTVKGNGANNINGMIHFDARAALQRAALTLANNRVYVAFASYEGFLPNHGWLLSFDAHSLALNGVFNPTPNGQLGGIWQSGGPIAVDDQGSLYVTVSNGTFDTQLDANGFPANGDYGDSVLKLTPDLHVIDYFTPYNQQALADLDQDLGSSTPLLLPDSAGSAAHPHLLVAEGKEGTIYLIDRDNMGHYDSQGNYVVQELTKATHGLFGNMAYFNGALYVSTPGANAMTFAVVPGAAHLEASDPTKQSANTFGYPGSTPMISADGAQNGIVWALSAQGTWNGLTIGNGTLRAYEASGGYSVELWNSNQDSSRDQLPSYTKFSVPEVQNGRVFVGTSRFLVGYGPLTNPPGSQGYVGALYSALLGRAPDDAGADNWNSLLGSTAHRDYVAQGILSAPEYKQQLVQSWYQHYLHRAADPQGLAFLTSLLQAGSSDEDVLAHVLTSPEYLTLNGHTPADWIAGLYRDVFGRTASASELTYWSGILGPAQNNYAAVAQGFLDSDEYRHLVIDSYYQSLLGRSIDDGSMTYWLAAKNFGISNESILLSIVTSDEYLLACQQ